MIGPSPFLWGGVAKGRGGVLPSNVQGAVAMVGILCGLKWSRDGFGVPSARIRPM